MSSATASGRDHVPSDKPKLKIKMCLFVITRKDGTPFDATPVTNEDNVKMCIKLGHIHPLGVLCYSAMESVTLFCSTEEMQHATCGAVKAMELQEEAIAIRAVVPSETHVKAYIIAVGEDSSMKTPVSILRRGGRTPFTHDNPHPSGEMPHHLQAELGDLANHGQHQLVEDFCQKITLHELNAAPSSPAPMPWGHPSGSRNAKEGNQEVTFPRGGGWVPLGQPSPSPTPA